MSEIRRFLDLSGPLAYRSLLSERRRTDEGIEITPVRDFLEELWGGGIA